MTTFAGNRPRRRTPAAVIGVFGCAALFEQIVKNLLVVDDPRSKTSKRNLTCVIRDVCSLRIALANKKKFPLPHEVSERHADDRLSSLKFWPATAACKSNYPDWVSGPLLI